MDTLPELLFAVAAEIEGAALRERLEPPGSYPGVELAVLGVGDEGTVQLERLLAGRVPGAVVSPGLAGALDPGLRPGAVVLIERWVAAEPPYPTVAEADPALRARVDAALRAARVPHRSGVAVTVDAPMHDVELRHELHDRAGAAVVEMEGRRWAGVATAARAPFASVRVISDDAATPLPLPRHLLLERSGRIRWSRWLRALAERGVPEDAEQQLERLFRARTEWLRAMASIDAVAGALLQQLS